MGSPKKKKIRSLYTFSWFALFLFASLQWFCHRCTWILFSICLNPNADMPFYPLKCTINNAICLLNPHLHFVPTFESKHSCKKGGGIFRMHSFSRITDSFDSKRRCKRYETVWGVNNVTFRKRLNAIDRLGLLLWVKMPLFSMFSLSGALGRGGNVTNRK